MEKVDWKVDGMTCSNCALTVSNYLQREGLHEVAVNPISGAVSFQRVETQELSTIRNGLDKLGYPVVEAHQKTAKRKPFLSTDKQRFLFTLPFTLTLMLHMLPHSPALHWLMNPWIQLALCLPVLITGMWFFGRSAIKSLRNGVPNMNVLISIGSLAAFVYSLIGALLQLGEQYLFFETAASIITLVFFGNYLEEVSINKTQRDIESLATSQKVMANMIAFDADHQEQIFPVENSQLRNGDLVLIKNGEQVPADCKILTGEAVVNEAIITGESTPVFRKKKDMLIGGSILDSGIVKAQVTAAGKDTVLAGILRMVEEAQAQKPPMQKLADKISAVFVPLVLAIAVITILVNFFIVNTSFQDALMRSIAVLVIACPCAMGLATPAAIAVGMGRAARSGILFRNASALEAFKNIRQVVFDKTGTLTTGNFAITGFSSELNPEEFKKISASLHSFSNHPVAKAIASNWQIAERIQWRNIEEIKGMGMRATDAAGNLFESGSGKLVDELTNASHSLYITKNKKIIGWIDLQDEIRPEAKKVIDWFHARDLNTILLSGDTQKKCEEVAAALGIKTVYAEQTPAEKLELIGKLNALQPTAMVGDGINDAPALAKATLGVSLSEASQIAMQSADVILMRMGLKNLPAALGLGRHTFLTIKQNLFWAFLYNIVAIPVAAVGLLTPTLGALAMGLSDVVLVANSVRLFVKKVD